jgi:hypothetical protein
VTADERERIEAAAVAAADEAEPLTEAEQRKLRILLAHDRAS